MQVAANKDSAALGRHDLPATSMKMLFLCLLMTSIWMASHYGARALAARQRASASR
jgi:hypothetical protein